MRPLNGLDRSADKACQALLESISTTFSTSLAPITGTPT
jgi:hypothetical protein